QATGPQPAPNFLRIDQASPQTVIDWNSFNIAAGSSVRFFQPSATAEALNRIFDKDPTVIQGSLSANGRIYLVNQNGILFDRGSQVDARGLIASALDISIDLFNKGIFTVPTFTPAAQGSALLLLDQNGQAVRDAQGQVIIRNSVENDGVIRSVDPDGSSPGGFIMLFAPKVSNLGQIVANNGQVVLAAGEQVFLRPNADSAGNLSPDMRGMLVEVRATNTQLNLSDLIAALNASNAGVLQADRGNVTLAGLAVNQSGRITAGTAVNQNGSIYLRAREDPFAGPSARAGTLTLAPGS